MTLLQEILKAYPELQDNPKKFSDGTIHLQNDGKGDYIKEWNYEKPLIDSLKDSVG